MNDALFDCFDQGNELDTQSIIHAIGHTVPLSVTMGEEIKRLRQWASNRAPRASEKPNIGQDRRVAA